MIILLVVVVVLLAGLVAAVLAGRIPAGGLLPPVSSESAAGLPRGGMEPADLAALRFDMVPRGYRMSQVDAVLERLVDEVRTRDAEIALLRAEMSGEGPVVGEDRAVTGDEGGGLPGGGEETGHGGR